MSFISELLPFQSSAIRTVDYDGYTLTVQFHSGRVYSHAGVPQSVYDAFMSAASKGRYYNQHIRGRYG